MPHIGAAMERTLMPQRSLIDLALDLVARSVTAAMVKRDAVGDAKQQVTDVKTAFSSWDNCMQASFCKWPAIGIMIFVGLIVFSVVWCCIRCICCGLSCCCSCFQCLKCCGNCCGCCDSPQKRNKYLDEPFVPPNYAQNQGYRPEAPMVAPVMAPAMAPTMAPVRSKPEPPQYAEFDSGPKGGGDELPSMPSWEGASSKKVLIEEEAVELEQLKKPDPAPNARLMGAMAPNPMSSPVSPAAGHGPYGPPQASQNGYMAAARSESNLPYGQGQGQGQGQGYGNYNNGGYQQPQETGVQGYGNQGYGNQGYGNQGAYDTQVYGAPGYGTEAMGAGAAGAAGAAMMGQGRQTPHQDYDNGAYARGPMDQGYPAPSQTPRPYDQYSRSGTPAAAGQGRQPPRYPTPQGNGAYGTPNRMQSPAPQPSAYNQGGYGGGYDQRSQTPNSYGRQQPPAPYRQNTYNAAPPSLTQPPAPRRLNTYDAAPPSLAQASAPRRQNTYDAAPPPLAQPPPTAQQYDAPPPASPIQNTGGFDFTSGFSRPGTTEPVAPPAQSNTTGGGYPGYRAYKPQQ